MKHRPAMHWLFGVGVAAARRQLLAIAIITLTYVIVHVFGLAGPLVSKTSSGRIVASPILVWSYLLLAVNSAMVGQYAIEMTAARILQISRRISPMHPHQVVERLQAYLWLAAIGETVLTLLPAPSMVVFVSDHLGSAAVGAIGWHAVMSIGMAFFGANALAAQRGC